MRMLKPGRLVPEAGLSLLEDEDTITADAGDGCIKHKSFVTCNGIQDGGGVFPTCNWYQICHNAEGKGCGGGVGPFKADGENGENLCPDCAASPVNRMEECHNGNFR